MASKFKNVELLAEELNKTQDEIMNLMAELDKLKTNIAATQHTLASQQAGLDSIRELIKQKAKKYEMTLKQHWIQLATELSAGIDAIPAIATAEPAR